VPAGSTGRSSPFGVRPGAGRATFAAGDVPQRMLTVAPHLPPRWGRLALRRLRLGGVSADVTAAGGAATVAGLPDDWRHDGADAPDRGSEPVTDPG
jgi:hypothetical protein